MTAGAVCPVCEIPYHADDGRAPSPPIDRPAPTFAGRLWQSGRLALLISVACLALGTFVPLLTVQRADHLGPRVAKTPFALITADGMYGTELKSTTLIAVPGAAFFLLTFLWSRQTRSVAMASRPLVLATSLLPFLGALMPVLKLAKHHRYEYHYGPAYVLVLLGTVFGVIASLRFGSGMPEPRRGRERNEGDDD
jgi:hypothetical protein